MDAIKFIINEHNRFKKTFSKINKGNFLTRLVKTKLPESTRHKMLVRLCGELALHEKMEETIWYPALRREKIKVNDVIRHLITEEKAASRLIKSFKNVKTEAVWEKKFEKLQSAVLHHAHEEETKLLPIAERTISQKRLREIGKQLKAWKAVHSKKKVVKKAVKKKTTKKKRKPSKK